MGLTLPDRVVYTLLRDKLQLAFRNEILADLLEDSSIGLEMMDEVKKFFGKEKRHVHIMNYFPQREMDSPLVSVIPGQDALRNDIMEIALERGSITDAESENGNAFTKQVRIVSAAAHPLIAMVLSALCQYVCLSNREMLHSNGCQNLKIVCPEVEIYQQYLPRGVFSRSMLFTFDVLDTYPVDKVAGGTGTIGGIKSIATVLEGKIDV